MILLSLFLAAAPARAVEPSVLDAGTFKYEIAPQNFLGANVPDLLRRGVVLGRLKSGDVVGLQNPSQIKGYFETLAEQAKAEKKAVKEKVDERAHGLGTPQPATQPTTQPATQPSTRPTTQPTSPEIPFDLKNFQSCARTMLPFVRMALATQGQDAQEIYQDRLNQERWDGSRNSSTGLICGRHLQSAAGESFDLKQDAKTLLAFATAQDLDELERLLLTYIATFNTQSPVVGQALWKLIWASQSQTVVFRKPAQGVRLQEALEVGESLAHAGVPLLGVAAEGQSLSAADIVRPGLKFAQELLEKLRGTR